MGIEFHRHFVRVSDVCIIMFAVLTSSGAPVQAQAVNDALTFLEVFFDADPRIDGLNLPSSVVVSNEGNHVYVLSSVGHRIAVFERDLSLGTLRFLESVEVRLPGARIGQIPTAAALSSDGRFLFVSVPRQLDLQSAMFRFLRDPTTGVLAFDGALVNDPDGLEIFLGSPQEMAISPDKNFLYVSSGINSSDIDSGSLSVFHIDSDTGSLAFVQRLDNDEAVPSGLFRSTDIVISPDGRHLYIGSEVDRGVGVFARHELTGALAFSSFQGIVDPPFVSSRLAIAPDGAHLYVASVTNAGLSAFERDADSGSLTFVQTLTPEDDELLLNFPDAVLVSPQGDRIYTIDRVPFADVLAYSRDASTGRFELIEVLEDGVTGAPVLFGTGKSTLSPDGGQLYITSSSSDTLTVISTSLPPLPCIDFPMISDQHAALREAFALDEDIDDDGLPEIASLTLIEQLACQEELTASLNSTTANYLLNLAASKVEPPVLVGMHTGFEEALAALMMVSEPLQVALHNRLSVEGFLLDQFYVVLTCDDMENCSPTRAPNEPLSGEGDLDEDGVSNAEEYENTIERGGSILEFARAALDPAFDGTQSMRAPASGGGGGTCFIATAAYGTPLAEEIDALRSLRDRYLLKHPVGTAFVDFYYRLSPGIADSVARSTALTAIVRTALVPIVFLSTLAVATPVYFALSLFAVGALIALLARKRRNA